MTDASIAAVQAAARLLRRRSRNAPLATPPPLPLISLPPGDEWEEFDLPTRTGFAYELPHVDLPLEDDSKDALPAIPSPTEAARACRLLSDYMAQNEMFQIKRHGFGVDTRLVYKRMKPNAGAGQRPSPGIPDEVEFDALFESGNLDRAFRIVGRHYASSAELLGTATQDASSPPPQWNPPLASFVRADLEYDLYCDTDIHTYGHIQWYFFRAKLSPNIPLRTVRKDGSISIKVRFNLRNMLKKASLYNEGMLPAVYLEQPTAQQRGWHHTGINVCYYRNADTYRNRKTGKLQNYYTLSFVYEFVFPPEAASVAADDMITAQPQVVYFAHCYPYTYTKLQRYLLSLQKDPERSRFFKRRVLCRTIAGNQCDLLTITDFSQDDDTDADYAHKRPGIVLSARVHPGESNASYIMHGIIDFLTGTSLEARFLRHRFIFKVIPMLNPDGVIHGNYRCSLAGTDLNRRWIHPSIELHPTIYATKNVILYMKKTRPVLLFCDIHGHSRKKNVFLYGCKPYDVGFDRLAATTPNNTDGAAIPAARAQAARIRLFPHILAKTSSSARGGFYSFPDCTFTVTPSKKGTGRVVVWREAEVLHSFTLEASFYGVGVNKKHRESTVAAAASASAAASSSSLSSSTGPEWNTSSNAHNNNNRQQDTAQQPIVSRHFGPGDLRMAGVKLCYSLIPFAQVTVGLELPRRPMLQLTAARSPTISAYQPAANQPPNALAGGSSNSGNSSVSKRPQTSDATRRFLVDPPTSPLRSPVLKPMLTQRSGLDSPIQAQKVRLQPLNQLSPRSDGSRSRDQSFSQEGGTTVLTLASNESTPRSGVPPANDDSFRQELESLDTDVGGSFQPSFGTGSGLPSEFDQLFQSDEFASMLSIQDADELLKEIEADMPENLDAIDWEEESVGSESDPSADDMEPEELAREGSYKDLVANAPKEVVADVKPPTPARQRIKRIMRHFSESRLDVADHFKLKVVVETAIKHATEIKEEVPKIDNTVRVGMAPVRRISAQRATPLPRPVVAIDNSGAKDRNRDIAAMHRCAVQRRFSRVPTRRRDVQQPAIAETNEASAVGD
ncbi:TPA: hypothetical protein N0F65_007167 [Lagenidium giganteum]|uniref:Peptidase M14 domain-containing protein n=1 Tax=Lagenidium giganteum TaxID=4803 RepID=A0AAV2Z5W8_9STRA|nr:TPA: hypothetical protein N0F65_007167 [Lagenidium giganteum]